MLGKYSEATELLQEQSQVNPKNFKTDQNLGCINGKVKEKNYAEISLNPKLIYYINLAIATIYEGNTTEISKNINLALSALDSVSSNNLPTS